MNYLINHRHVSLVLVVFPRSAGSEEQERIQMLNSLVQGYGCAPGTEYDLQWRELQYMWASRSETGERSDMLFWFHSWVSSEKEEEYKRTSTRRSFRKSTDEEWLSLEEWFDRSLKDLGAVEWGQEHWDRFKMVPRVFVGEPTIGRFVRNGTVVAGRKVVERPRLADD